MEDSNTNTMTFALKPYNQQDQNWQRRVHIEATTFLTSKPQGNSNEAFWTWVQTGMVSMMQKMNMGMWEYDYWLYYQDKESNFVCVTDNNIQSIPLPLSCVYFEICPSSEDESKINEMKSNSEVKIHTPLFNKLEIRRKAYKIFIAKQLQYYLLKMTCMCAK